MENRNKIIIAILTVAVIVLGIITVYFGITSTKAKGEVDSVKNELSNVVNEKEGMEIELQESNNKINTIKDTLGVSDNTSSNNSQSFEIKELDATKGINIDYNKQICYESIYDSACGINAKINNSNKNEVGINYFGEEIKRLYNIDCNNAENNNLSITLDKKVNKILIASISHQSAHDSIILFLMEDGTLEYIPIYTALKNNNFNIAKKIDGIDGIKDLSVVHVNGKQGGGYGCPAAVKADGSFYVLNNDYIKIEY